LGCLQKTPQEKNQVQTKYSAVASHSLTSSLFDPAIVELI